MVISSLRKLVLSYLFVVSAKELPPIIGTLPPLCIGQRVKVNVIDLADGDVGADHHGDGAKVGIYWACLHSVQGKTSRYVDQPRMHKAV